MSVVEEDKKSREEGIGCNQKEAIIEKTLEIKRKAFKGRLVLFDQIEWSDIGNESGEEHVDHEDHNHFGNDLVTEFGMSVVVWIFFWCSYDPAEEWAEERHHDRVYKRKDYVAILHCFLLLYQFLCEGHDQEVEGQQEEDKERVEDTVSPDYHTLRAHVGENYVLRLRSTRKYYFRFVASEEITDVVAQSLT